jgi:hypothetical protein
MKNKIKLTNWDFDIVTVSRIRSMFYRWSEDGNRCYVKIVILNYDDGKLISRIYIKVNNEWEKQIEIIEDDISVLKFKSDLFIFKLGFLPDISPRNYK